MRISTFLPHVGVFGGVRRYLELGNVWAHAGHEVTLYHPTGAPPAWLPFRGQVASLADAGNGSADLAICGDAGTFDAFAAHRAGTHLYYCVLEGDPGLPRALALPEVRLAANSGPLRASVARAARRPVLDGIGGINLRQFHPDPVQRAAAPLRILLNGRRSRVRKGTDLILKALAGLRGAPEFDVVLFDSIGPENRQDPRDDLPSRPPVRFVIDPTQDELAALYQSAHVFVAAERRAGWCNTALEAMASGAAVVCTPSGTTDFARDGENARVVQVRHPWFLRRAIAQVLRDAALRERLATAGPKTAAQWSWEMLAAKLLAQVGTLAPLDGTRP